MQAVIFVVVDVSDDDVALAEIASQCGYDVRHPMVVEVAEPQVAERQGEHGLLLTLTLNSDLSAALLVELLQQCQITLSHPSLCSFSAREIARFE
jgi:hypothetical protein